MNVREAYTEFIRSREAMACTERTLGTYEKEITGLLRFPSLRPDRPEL